MLFVCVVGYMVFWKSYDRLQLVCVMLEIVFTVMSCDFTSYSAWFYLNSFCIQYYI